MNKALGVAALLALGGCHRSAPPEAAPLAGAAIGGAFTLTDQDGQPFSSQRLAGRWPVFYFGYTFCPDACPTAMTVLAHAQKLLAQQAPAKAAKLQLVFVSVDPARDTPPVLRQWVRAFSPTLIGLTGTPAAIDRVAKAYGAYYQRQAPVAGASGYLVQHATTPILFDPQGRPVALVPVDGTAQDAADLLARWIR